MSNELSKTVADTPVEEKIEIMPPVDITEEDDCYNMFFEVPGTNASSVKAEVENSILTVECASTLRKNNRPVLYKRVFRLTRAVDVNKITAEVKDGILSLKLPKADHVKPFKVPVA